MAGHGQPVRARPRLTQPEIAHKRFISHNLFAALTRSGTTDNMDLRLRVALMMGGQLCALRAASHPPAITACLPTGSQSFSRA